MSSDVEDLSLTPNEREIARGHWDAMMFAPSRSDLEKARRALMDAPFLIQQAVIADINANWLREYEPAREENPFLPPGPFQDVAPVTNEENNEDVRSEQIEFFRVEPIAEYTAPSHSLPNQSLTSYAHRLIQSIIHLSTTRVGGRMTSHSSSFQGASPHH